MRSFREIRALNVLRYDYLSEHAGSLILRLYRTCDAITSRYPSKRDRYDASRVVYTKEESLNVKVAFSVNKHIHRRKPL